MASIFVYEQTGRHELAELLKRHDLSLVEAEDPELALSYCFSAEPFSVIILELDRMQSGVLDRSGHELIFFHSVSLIRRGTPIVLVAPDPKLFLPEFTHFGFQRIVDPDYLLRYLALKRERGNEHRSLGEYGAYVIGVPSPIATASFVRLIETICDDVLHTVA